MVRDLPSGASFFLGDAAIGVFFDLTLISPDGEELRLWSGYGDKIIDGETFTGAGDLMQIEEIPETSDLSANLVSFSISGMSEDIANYCYGVNYQGGSAELFVNLVTSQADYFPFVDLPMQDPQQTFRINLFSGMMDVLTVKTIPAERPTDRSTVNITLTCESDMVDLDTPRHLRYNHASQKRLFPYDRAFEFTEGLKDQRLRWLVSEP